ncbi:MAG: hypothetical protein WCR31_11640 [Treponema sp.]
MSEKENKAQLENILTQLTQEKNAKQEDINKDYEGVYIFLSFDLANSTAFKSWVRTSRAHIRMKYMKDHR